MGEANRKSEEKKKLFESDPEKFICTDDVVMQIDIDKDGEMGLFINGEHAKHIPQAIGLLMLQAPRADMYFKAKAMKESQGGIITPGKNGSRL